MRFSTENEALNYLIGKLVKDPASPGIVHSITDWEKAKTIYRAWIDRKQCMFSPQEYRALITPQGIMSKILGKLLGSVSNQDVLDGWSNAFVDWAEGKPRRKIIIIVDSFWQLAANDIALQIDKIGGNQTFSGLGLSPTGKKPATYYGCGWNCSANEYDFLAEKANEYAWWHIWDGNKTQYNEILKMLNLIQIEEEV